MKFLFCVEKFGKIESAKIDINNFTIFIGNNNSGKTQLMELIYGIYQTLPKLRINYDHIRKKNDLQWKLDKDDIYTIVDEINRMLNDGKDQIVKNIFRNHIPLSSMYFGVSEMNETYEISIHINESMDSISKSEGIDNKGIIENIESDKNISCGYIYEIQENGQKTLRAITSMSGDTDERIVLNEIIRLFVCVIFRISGQEYYSQMLFLPASRMGLITLYKYYFDTAAKSGNGIVIEGEGAPNRDNIPLPIVDFLSFLLRYEYSETNAESNHDLVNFINSHMIEGAINEKGNMPIYHDLGQNINVPLFLSSSMVNEMDPLVKFLTDTQTRRVLFYDEVETSLHPLKQLEMVKLLNRLNNHGIRLFISTHSDTMAVKINNLLLLSKSKARNKEKAYAKKGKVEIEQEDLLATDDVHIYQFTIGDSGKSKVEELAFRTTPLTGYQFSLFDESNTTLFDEAKSVFEDIEE